MPIDQLVSLHLPRGMRVDVLHLSPPCQYFSPAHTVPSHHDDTNIFALYGCNELLARLRPRIATVEQTFGITHRRHESHLHSLVSDFTQYGYSVRWKVVKLARWGAAQNRTRLIIIAAAPGETLPTFPADTHSLDGFGGTLPYTTVGDAIAGVGPGDDLHDVDGAASQPCGTRLDANHLASTIMCSNVRLRHPSEARNLTLRELACLQGFPSDHRFLGPVTKIRRQIGNAFPPNAVGVLFQHLGEWLSRVD
ncbi:S-adenosyl-L-methionine-dependent methyltransferase, partial [Fusarium flagelliforme]|uniref:S-adenosyl-L-methionine-dependent methyltransferase n=1 Tax=Fusarium flagelliforme TaxID=2675880 RepID=UPI001E8E541A